MAPTLTLHHQHVEPRADESVLDALLRAGIDTPFSCRGGSCLTCMLHCDEGQVDPAAQQALSESLRQKGYFLPCKCKPVGDMRLSAPDPVDLVTRCVFCEAELQPSGRLRLVIEPQGTLRYRQGQTVRVVTGGEIEPLLEIVSDPDRDYMLLVEADASAAAELPEALRAGAEFGTEFELRGPFDKVRMQDLPLPPADPELWALLDDGKVVRSVLEDFYAKVYADARLAPFFQGVTQERAIGKQYSFLMQCMTGQKVYMGDRPRNAHHWMIIPDGLFDHRQRLMRETLLAHGLAQPLVQRWQHFEEYFRPDIVKQAYWPRLVDGKLVSKEGFQREVIGEATLCDHCHAEVAAGDTVLLNRRTGEISCAHCSPALADAASA